VNRTSARDGDCGSGPLTSGYRGRLPLFTHDPPVPRLEPARCGWLLSQQAVKRPAQARLAGCCAPPDFIPVGRSAGLHGETQLPPEEASDSDHAGVSWVVVLPVAAAEASSVHRSCTECIPKSMQWKTPIAGAARGSTRHGRHLMSPSYEATRHVALAPRQHILTEILRLPVLPPNCSRSPVYRPSVRPSSGGEDQDDVVMTSSVTHRATSAG
jgi:hypothetical protein